MSGWKILITDELDESGLQILSKQAQIDNRPGLPSAQLLETIEDFEALIANN